MQVTLECHGVLQQLCGGAEREVALAGQSADVVAVLAALSRDTPGVDELLPRVACARGDQLLSRKAEVADGDRLALIPPVSGG